MLAENSTEWLPRSKRRKQIADENKSSHGYSDFEFLNLCAACKFSFQYLMFMFSYKIPVNLFVSLFQLMKQAQLHELHYVMIISGSSFLLLLPAWMYWELTEFVNQNIFSRVRKFIIACKKV